MIICTMQCTASELYWWSVVLGWVRYVQHQWWRCCCWDYGVLCEAGGKNKEPRRKTRQSTTGSVFLNK